MVFSFLCSFSCLMAFHLFALVNVVVNQKASTEADVMSKLTESWSTLLTTLMLETVERFVINETGYFNNCDATNSTFFYKSWMFKNISKMWHPSPVYHKFWYNQSTPLCIFDWCKSLLKDKEANRPKILILQFDIPFLASSCHYLEFQWKWKCLTIRPHSKISWPVTSSVTWFLLA